MTILFLLFPNFQMAIVCKRRTYSAIATRCSTYFCLAYPYTQSLDVKESCLKRLVDGLVEVFASEEIVAVVARTFQFNLFLFMVKN